MPLVADAAGGALARKRVNQPANGHAVGRAKRETTE